MALQKGTENKNQVRILIVLGVILVCVAVYVIKDNFFASAPAPAPQAARPVASQPGKAPANAQKTAATPSSSAASSNPTLPSSKTQTRHPSASQTHLSTSPPPSALSLAAQRSSLSATKLQESP